MKKDSNWLEDTIETENYKGITGRAVLDEDPVNELISLALLAFERCDYDLAEQRIEDAQSSLLFSVKGNFGLFLLLYWPFILFTASAFSLFGIVGYRKYKKSSVTKKIEDFDKEEENIRKLMQETQRKYFSGKMGASQYHFVLNQHNKRIALVRKRRIILRNKRIKLLRPEQIMEDLNVEAMQVESEMKKIQQEYYIDKKISEKEYKTQFGILNERLAENEGERSTLELIKEKKGGNQIKNPKEKGKFLLEKKEGKQIEKQMTKATEGFKEKGERKEKVKMFFFKIIRKPVDWAKKIKEKITDKVNRKKEYKDVSEKEYFKKKNKEKEMEKDMKPKQSGKEKLKIFKNKTKNKTKKIWNSLKKLPRKFSGKIKKDKRGVILIDNEIIDVLKKEVEGKDYNKKWIKLNLKENSEKEGIK